MSKCGVISGPYFPVFELNTEIYGANLHIQSEYRKIHIRNKSIFGHFSHSESYVKRCVLYCMSTIRGYVQVGLRKRQLIGSSVEHFNRKSEKKVFVFQSHITKSSNKGVHDTL